VKHRFHPAAKAEHLEQIAYFEEQQAGLGRRYLTEVESAIARACAAPRQHRVEQAPDLRRIAVHGFPFTILFREEGGLVQVLAIAHFRRRPRYWLTRLT
jgi:plasmid stabilization system protein ParE